uniref:Uncharacterized protein n=1 Tax=Trypanosoma vivax (strain Y486) TaxID=1055687 RepID=G0TX82_TRYVY|nr:conserved hypothetical protein [Trypanosoma vivax Y486]
MPLCPGLCGEMAALPYRVFLGTLPVPAVEERFLRQLQPVFAWYTTRKRVREQANEFVEIDLASCDLELLLRYTHVYYVRRQLFDEAIERQISLLDSGKSPQMADAGLLQCLTVCNSFITDRLQHEARILERAKRAAVVPGRRELNPTSALSAYDFPCMMRLVEEDTAGVADAEMKARSYLPRQLIDSKLRHLTEQLLGSDAKPALEKREMKLLNRILLPDYTRVGCVEKLRPFDVTSYFRFYGERIANLKSDNYFKRALWGHAYRKFATSPSFLRGISLYWARYSGLDACSESSLMPIELATAVCQHQVLFPATRFRSQYVYTSSENARQLWRTDVVIPLVRLFPLMGARAAEDLAAGVLMDAFWARLPLDEGENLLQDSFLRSVRQFVDQMGHMYEVNLEDVLKHLEEGCKVAIPPLTEAETVSTLPQDNEDVAAAQ